MTWRTPIPEGLTIDSLMDWKEAVSEESYTYPQQAERESLQTARRIVNGRAVTEVRGAWSNPPGSPWPAAGPFIFNGLKICTTLSLIGAIVAEFFGTPIVGMGFRISTEIGRMALDMVWAEIAVAALAGSAFYGVVALIERSVTFWHPSNQG